VIDPEAMKMEGLRRYVPSFETLLDDLTEVTDEELQARGLASLQALALWMLRDARNPDRFFRHLLAWAHLLNELCENPATRSGAAILMRYITTVLGDERTDQLRTELAKLAPSAEKAMQSIAEAFEKKGLKDGLEKGLVEGQREILERLLVKKFRALSEDLMLRLQAASTEQLNVYAERILDADRIEQVFE
jgi:hypothetical protein